jgi:hypothetical protein
MSVVYHDVLGVDMVGVEGEADDWAEAGAETALPPATPEFSAGFA